MKTSEQRINTIIGQLEGVKRMIAQKNKDCFASIVQLKAVHSATASLMTKIIAEEMDRCLLGKNQKKEDITKIFKEIIK